jgi:hypothetical protein
MWIPSPLAIVVRDTCGIFALARLVVQRLLQVDRIEVTEVSQKASNVLKVT